MNIIFSALLFFAMLVTMPCIACSQQSGPAGAGVGPDAQFAGGPDSGRQNGRTFTPPPEAYKACEGKTAGSQVQLVNPRGETITGTCQEKDGKLFLRPDRPMGGDSGRQEGRPRGESGKQDGRQFGPPPEAYKACEGKTAGSTAQFVSPRGETITGTCQDKDGRMVLRPDRPMGSGSGRQEGGRPTPPAEAYKACEGKTAGSPAQFTDQRGTVVKGTCEKEGDRLFLRPDWFKQNAEGGPRR